MKGKVYLAGGGPGDAELLTRKAYRLIQEADCLIYDRLVNPRILEEAREGCDKIYVGKENRNHSMKQEDINQLLVEKAAVYKKVVRLKGGDVYVFGRGGEEALFLQEHDIDFEIVPGISSCIAGPAYAGIPITHRGIAGGFHVVTAHNKRNELADIDFGAMAESGDTCVFLMGLSKLPDIAAKLMEAGKPLDTKVAVISNATLPAQEVLTATLQTVSESYRQHPLPSPGLIVVGEVVGLREKLAFYEKKPLFGTKIFLPRAGNGISVLGEKLTALGAFVQEVQTSLLREDKKALDMVSYPKYTHIILTSKNAVRYFINSLRKNKIDIRSLHHIAFAVVGNATGEYLEEFGIYASIMPDTYHQDALFEALKPRLKPTDRILFPKESSGEETREVLEDKLAEICGIDVIALYEKEPVEKQAVLAVLQQMSFDMAVFTCSSSVHHTIQEIKEQQDLNRMKIISIGEKTTETLKSYGISHLFQAERAAFDSVVDTVLAQSCGSHNTEESERQR